MRRKPPVRDLPPRSSENEKRALSPAIPTAERIADLLLRASYEGYGKHKRNPHLWNLEPFHGNAPDRTFCEDAGFTIGDQHRLPGLLVRGISAGLFGDGEKQGDPTKLWTIDHDGRVYELALTIPGRALYHGYPLRRADAMARKVIRRFEDYVLSLDPKITISQASALDALRAAQSFYS